MALKYNADLDSHFMSLKVTAPIFYLFSLSWATRVDQRIIFMVGIVTFNMDSLQTYGVDGDEYEIRKTAVKLIQMKISILIIDH